MLNFNSLLIFSENPGKLSEFYTKVLGRKPDWEDGDWSGFTIGDGNLAIGPHSEVHGKSKEPARIMFNLETDDVKGEFARIKELGAKVIAEPYTMGGEDSWIATFADLDGNYFQLTSPFETDTSVN